MVIMEMPGEVTVHLTAERVRAEMLPLIVELLGKGCSPAATVSHQPLPIVQQPTPVRLSMLVR